MLPSPNSQSNFRITFAFRKAPEKPLAHSYFTLIPASALVPGRLALAPDLQDCLFWTFHGDGVILASLLCLASFA